MTTPTPTTREAMRDGMARAVKCGLNRNGAFDIASPDEGDLDDREAEEWQSVEYAADAILAYLESFAVVAPKVATAEMRKDGAMQIAMRFQRIQTAADHAECVYDAMLRANPFVEK